MKYIVFKYNESTYVIAKFDQYTSVYRDYAETSNYQDAMKIAELLNSEL